MYVYLKNAKVYHVEFSIRGAAGQHVSAIGWRTDASDSGSPVTQDITLTEAWQKYEMDIPNGYTDGEHHPNLFIRDDGTSNSLKYEFCILSVY